jgi:hypothetical protein
MAWRALETLHPWSELYTREKRPFSNIEKYISLLNVPSGPRVELQVLPFFLVPHISRRTRRVRSQLSFSSRIRIPDSLDLGVGQ